MSLAAFFTSSGFALIVVIRLTGGQTLCEHAFLSNTPWHIQKIMFLFAKVHLISITSKSFNSKNVHSPQLTVNRIFYIQICQTKPFSPHNLHTCTSSLCVDIQERTLNIQNSVFLG